MSQSVSGGEAEDVPDDESGRRRKRVPLRVSVEDVPRTSAVSDLPPPPAQDADSDPEITVGEIADDAEELEVEVEDSQVGEAAEVHEVALTAVEAPLADEADVAGPAEETAPAGDDHDAEEVELDDHEIIDEQAAAPPKAPPKPPKAPPAPPPGAPPMGMKKRRRPWYETFFSDDYLRTVRAPTPKEVARECDFIVKHLGLSPGATILDVGCGLGLHACELTSRGFLVVGLDLSLPMLSRAGDEAQDLGLKINFLHGDMREMNFEGAFDAVLCWGTTFGYFEDEVNKQVIGRFRRALRPGGVLLLDVTNRDHSIRNQPNLVWFEGDACVCMEETSMNYITSRLEVKRTVILDDGRQREKHYSIRLYALHELGQYMHQKGFRVAKVTGHHAMPGVFFGADSPRMIILAERRALPEDEPKTGSTKAPPPPGVPGADKASPPPPPSGAAPEAAASTELEDVHEVADVSADDAVELEIDDSEES